ncbi:MAG: ATP synthase F0 subunit B [Ruminococcus sp.]
MPLNIDIMQILLHAFNFLILAGGLTLILFKPVNKFLAERRAYFESKEAEIKEKTDENEKLKAEYEEKLAEANKQIAEMHAAAEKEIAETTKAYLIDAKEKAKTIISDAEQEAENRKEHILDSAQAEIGALVVSATQKLLSDTVTPERNSALYDEFIRLADQTVADKRAKK